MVFCPLPTQYAVIHIDALAAVEHLQDPEATAAAQRFQSKLYIAYFRGLDTLPIPQRPWFRIAVDIIGRGPCADNPAERYTPEMYVPISPSAVAHPSGREPIHPNRPFPFPGCSHWVGTTTTVLVKKGKYDVLTEKGHFLKVPAERKMVNWLADDFRRSRAALYEAACDDTTSVISELSSEPTNTHCCHSPIDYDNTDKLSFSVCSCETTSYYSEDVPIDEMLFPVVDAWLELEEHITVEEMGSPLDFVKERDALVAIIKDARARLEAKDQQLSEEGSQSTRSLASAVLEKAPLPDLVKDNTARSTPSRSLVHKLRKGVVRLGRALFCAVPSA